jgi:23S rRNA pseudoU1915 N3-methylase RlmH
MPIRIIAIGKKHEPWVAEGIERYQERLKRPFQIEWVFYHIQPYPTSERARKSLVAYFRA